MTFDDEERRLHAALGGLLVTEPPMASTVSDDVARGQTARTHRRVRAGAILAGAVVLAGVVAAAGAWRPVATSTPPAGGSPTPSRPASAEPTFVPDDEWPAAVEVAVAAAAPAARISPAHLPLDGEPPSFGDLWFSVTSLPGPSVLRLQVDASGSHVIDALASSPCAAVDSGCRVTQPWTLEDGVWTSVAQRTGWDADGEATIRSALGIRGNVITALVSDTRQGLTDVRLHSTPGPGQTVAAVAPEPPLSTEALLTMLRTIPLPESARGAASVPSPTLSPSTPTGVPSGDASAPATMAAPTFVGNERWESAAAVAAAKAAPPSMTIQRTDPPPGMYLHGTARVWLRAITPSGSTVMRVLLLADRGVAGTVGSPPCGGIDQGCRALRDWSLDGGLWMMALDRTAWDDNGEFTQRVLHLVRGDVDVMVVTDTRAVLDGSQESDTPALGQTSAAVPPEPPLSLDALLAIARALPLPESVRTLALSPAPTRS